MLPIFAIIVKHKTPLILNMFNKRNDNSCILDLADSSSTSSHHHQRLQKAFSDSICVQLSSLDGYWQCALLEFKLWVRSTWICCNSFIHSFSHSCIHLFILSFFLSYFLSFLVSFFFHSFVSNQLIFDVSYVWSLHV